jgi:hypothetical protein
MPIIEYKGCRVIARQAVSESEIPPELTEGFLEFKFPDSSELPSLDDGFVPVPKIVMNGREGTILKVVEQSGGILDVTVQFS